MGKIPRKDARENIKRNKMGLIGNVLVFICGIYGWIISFVKLVLRGNISFLSLLKFSIYTVFKKLVIFHEFFEWLCYKYAWSYKSYVLFIIRYVFVLILLYIGYLNISILHQIMADLSAEVWLYICILLGFIIIIFFMFSLLRYLLLDSAMWYIVFIFVLLEITFFPLPGEYLGGMIDKDHYALSSWYEAFQRSGDFLGSHSFRMRFPWIDNVLFNYRTVYSMVHGALMLIGVSFIIYLIYGKSGNKQGFTVVKPMPYLNVGLGEVSNVNKDNAVMIFIKHLNWLVRNKPWKVEQYINLVNEEITTVLEDLEEDAYFAYVTELNFDPLYDNFEFQLNSISKQPPGYSEEFQGEEEILFDLEDEEDLPVNDLYPITESYYDDDKEDDYGNEEDLMALIIDYYRDDYLMEWDEQNEELLLKYFYWRYKWLLVIDYFKNDKLNLLGTYYKNYFNLFDKIELEYVNDQFTATFKKDCEQFINRVSYISDQLSYLYDIEFISDETDSSFIEEPEEPLYFESGLINYGDIIPDPAVMSKIEFDLYFGGISSPFAWKKMLTITYDKLFGKSYNENTFSMKYTSDYSIYWEDVEYYGIIKSNSGEGENVIMSEAENDKHTKVTNYKVMHYGDEVDMVLDHYFDLYMYSHYSISSVKSFFGFLNCKWSDVMLFRVFMWYDNFLKQLILYFPFCGSSGFVTINEILSLNRTGSNLFTLEDFYVDPEFYKNLNTFTNTGLELQMDASWQLLDTIFNLNNKNDSSSILKESFIKNLFRGSIRSQKTRFDRKFKQHLSSKLKKFGVYMTKYDINQTEIRDKSIQLDDMGFGKMTDSLRKWLIQRVIFKRFDLPLDELESNNGLELNELAIEYEEDFSDDFFNLQRRWLNGDYCDLSTEIISEGFETYEMLNDLGLFSISSFVSICLSEIEDFILLFDLVYSRINKFGTFQGLYEKYDNLYINENIMNLIRRNLEDEDKRNKEDDKKVAYLFLANDEVSISSNKNNLEIEFLRFNNLQFYLRQFINLDQLFTSQVIQVAQLLLLSMNFCNENNFGYDIRFVFPYFNFKTVYDVFDFRVYSLIGIVDKGEDYYYQFKFQVDSQLNNRILSNEDYSNSLVGRTVLKYNEKFSSDLNDVLFNNHYRIILNYFPIYSWNRALLNNYNYNVERYVDDYIDNNESLHKIVLQDL